MILLLYWPVSAILAKSSVYHMTEAELTLFLLSCIEGMLFFLVESRFSLVSVSWYSAVSCSPQIGLVCVV